jgi:hypothetical protein
MNRVIGLWKRFRSQSKEIQLAIATLVLAAIAIPVAFLAPIPWDLLKEAKARQQEDTQHAEDNARKQAELKEKNAKQRKRICDEFNKRYELFQGRIAVEDKSGAIRAFDTPAGRFATTEPDLNARDSKSLLKELLELSGYEMPRDLSQLQFDSTAASAFIQRQVDSIMEDVDKSCR